MPEATALTSQPPITVTAPPGAPSAAVDAPMRRAAGHSVGAQEQTNDDGGFSARAFTNEYAATGDPQLAARVVMVRPHHFRPNPVTAQDNAFGAEIAEDPVLVAERAHGEVSRLAEQLQRAGVGVDLFEDIGTVTPDSVFPNNWFSTHADGRLVLYPMFAPNRRGERRREIVEHLKNRYRVAEVLDLSGAEEHGAYLEGTGAMVLDHASRTAYACYSQRITATLFFRWCNEFMYEPVLFHAADKSGTPVYHTNVMLSVGSADPEHGLALIGSSMIRSRYERDAVLHRLRSTGRTVVELSEAQIRGFAANVLQLQGRHGPVLVMSTTARASFTPAQLQQLEAKAQIIAAVVPTIERAGGSVRCMLAQNYLSPQTPRKTWGDGNTAETSRRYPRLS